MEERPEVEPQNKEASLLFLPGLFGGGRNLTLIREALTGLSQETFRVFVPDSISTRYRRTFFDEILNSWLKAVEGKQPVIVAHSLGSVELFEVLKELKNRNVSNPFVILVSPLGTESTKGMGLIGRLRELALNAAFYDQHTVYPLPDKFYQDQDISPSRGERRETFLSIFGEEKVEFEGEKVSLREALEIIDGQLQRDDVSEEETHRLLRERARLLRPFIERMYRGEHVSEERHRKFMEVYREEISSLGLLANALRFLPKVLRTVLGPGDTIERIKKMCPNAKIAILGLENDVLLSPEKVNKLTEKGVAVRILPVYAHSSFAFAPETWADAIKGLIEEELFGLKTQELGEG